MSDCTGVVPSAPGAAAPGWAGKPRPRGPVAGVEITDMFSAVVVGDGVDLGEAAAAGGGLTAGVRGGDSASLSVSRFPPPLHRFLHTQQLGGVHGGVASGVRRMNEVNARRARLVLGWVTVFGQAYHLGM